MAISAFSFKSDYSTSIFSEAHKKEQWFSSNVGGGAGRGEGFGGGGGVNHLRFPHLKTNHTNLQAHEIKEKKHL